MFGEGRGQISYICRNFGVDQYCAKRRVRTFFHRTPPENILDICSRLGRGLRVVGLWFADRIVRGRFRVIRVIYRVGGYGYG